MTYQALKNNCHLLVKSIDDLANQEYYIVVFGDVLLFPKTYSISHFLKPLPFNYSIKKGGSVRGFYPLSPYGYF